MNSEITPTQVKARAKAKKLFNEITSLTREIHGGIYDVKNTQKELALNTCEQVLETVRQIKGRGKISKLKFWNYVKEYLKEL